MELNKAVGRQRRKIQGVAGKVKGGGVAAEGRRGGLVEGHKIPQAKGWLPKVAGVVIPLKSRGIQK